MQVLCGVTMFCNFAPWLEKLNKKSEGMEDTTFLLLMWCWPWSNMWERSYWDAWAAGPTLYHARG